MTYTYKFFHAQAYEYPALEAYLHTMSMQGWQLDRIFPFALRFVKRDEVNYYAILLQKKFESDNPFVKTKETKKISEFLEEFQLTYVCGYSTMQVFSSSSKQELYTEEQLHREQTLKESRKILQATGFLVFVIMFLYGISTLLDPHPERLKYALLGNINACLLILLYLTIVGYFLLQYRGYSTFKKTGIYIRDPAIFNTKRTFFTLYPLLVVFLASILMQSYVLILCAGIFFLAMLLDLYVSKLHRLTWAVTIGCFSFLYSIDGDQSTFRFHTDEPDGIYKTVLETIPLTYDLYHRNSSPLMEVEYINIKEYNALYHYTVKDTFAKSYILSSLYHDYGIDSTSHQPYYQTTCKAINNQEDFSMYQQIYLQEKLNNCHPMLIIPMNQSELWLLSGTYNDEEALRFVHLLSNSPPTSP